jgi:hypothetical protein
VECEHKVLWEYCAQASHSKSFDSLTNAEQYQVKQAAEEWYLAYLFLVNSGAQHDLLCKELQNDFTKGSNKYPENCPQVLLFLDRYSKSATGKSGSHGTAFAQKGGRSKKGDGKKTPNKAKGEKKDFDKEYYKDKPCFKCGKKGHPQSHRPSKDDDDDDSSISSKLSLASSKSSSKPKLKDFESQFKTHKKSFAQLKSAHEDDSCSESSDEMSHLLFGSKTGAASSSRKRIYGDLTYVRSSYSTTNQPLISSATRTCPQHKTRPRTANAKSNGGELLVYYIANVNDYAKPVWFSKKAIANIFALKAMKKQYRVSYNSSEVSFLVHRESVSLPNILFKEHANGLHFFDPREQDFAFVETVESNMKLFSKRQVARTDKACSLYASLGFPSTKDFLWILQSNQIKDCPITFDDAKVAYKIWGPSLAALKGKTVRKQPGPVKTETIYIPKEIRELHKEVTLTIDIFFVNQIPFFITLSRVIYFTTVTHLPNRSLGEIFKALKGIFYYYFQRGFRITFITGDGEFSSLKHFTNLLVGAPRLNLTSANEHEPFIERRIRVVKERV